MKRAGFTMIELIFVIVILGILSAVALPKFLGVADQAKAGKLTAYVGTLNTTTLPSIWSKAIMDGSGSIADYGDEINNNITAPDGITVTFSKDTLEPDTYTFTDETAPAADKIIGKQTYGGTVYSIACRDGNQVAQPLCDVYNDKQKKWVLKNKY